MKSTRISNWRLLPMSAKSYEPLEPHGLFPTTVASRGGETHRPSCVRTW